MDYIRQINAFENWVEFNEIGPGAQLLWYKLMRVANLSGWQNELSISNTKLISMTKSTEKTLINNRNQLIQNGLLQYKKRGRTKAGIYILTDITNGNIPVKTTEQTTVNIPVNTPVVTAKNNTTGIIPVDSTVISTVKPTVVSTVDSTVITSAYINKTKLNKTKEYDDHDGPYPAELIQNLYKQFPTGILQQAISEWIQTWPKDMICLAIQASFDQGVELRGLKGYINRILENWASKGTDTLEKAQQLNAEFKNRKKQGGFKKPVRTEPVPDWVDKKQEEISDPDMEARMAERLAQYQAKQQNTTEGAIEWHDAL